MQNHKYQKGFTLMEIVVATTIFAIVVTSLLSLFNYTLKINRKSEALRQAAQGMRNFVEFLVKEVRNGQIDYYVSGANLVNNLGPCQHPGAVGQNTYGTQENRLGIINTDNVQECFYFGDSSGNYLGNNIFDAVSPTDNDTLVLEKAGITDKQILNPSNFRIDKLMFVIRPQCDPYTQTCPGNSYPKIQPFVTILMKFTAQLPTGEVVPVYYQTSVSSQKYDIPNK
jgi:prepilin-type N-terminal cleavage/methylation domain-containing protein